jgi:hypothetical protein
VSEYTSKCPFCGTMMPNSKFRASEPWVCPGCSQGLMVSRTWGNAVTWGSIGFTFLVLFILGFRGLRLIVAGIVLWFPVQLLLFGFLDRTFPPKLEPYRAPGKGGLSLFNK